VSAATIEALHKVGPAISEVDKNKKQELAKVREALLHGGEEKVAEAKS
jgi:hypothetical protein